jgi:16S rRNA (uracil1498-N3)-methyltransferase
MERASARSVTAAVVGRVPSPTDPQLRVHLYQSIAKGERFEWLLEKATELGVARVVPLVTARSVVRTSGGGARSERWRRIVIEAAEQSGRGAVPEVTPPLAFADAVRGAPGVRLLPYERAGAHAGTIASALANGKVREVSMLIGPEGGFEDEEVQVARDAGFAIVSLGPRALRSETAGIVALTLAMEAGGELGR